jgi:hypothetical protein
LPFVKYGIAAVCFCALNGEIFAAIQLKKEQLPVYIIAGKRFFEGFVVPTFVPS